MTVRALFQILRTLCQPLLDKLTIEFQSAPQMIFTTLCSICITFVNRRYIFVALLITPRTPSTARETVNLHMKSQIARDGESVSCQMFRMRLTPPAKRMTSETPRAVLPTVLFHIVSQMLAVSCLVASKPLAVLCLEASKRTARS